MKTRFKPVPSDTLEAVRRDYRRAIFRWRKLDQRRRSAIYEIERVKYHDFERFCAECRHEESERRMTRSAWDAITKPLWQRATRLGYLVRVKARTAPTDRWFVPSEVEFVSMPDRSRRHLKRNPPTPFVVWNPDTQIEEERPEWVQTEYGLDHFEAGFEFPDAHVSPRGWCWVATYGESQEIFPSLEAARAWVAARSALDFHKVAA